VLLTSIAFAVGVVRLGRRQCLVQELPAIEGLARVDTVCADKTGTLTENGMRLAELRPVNGYRPDQIASVLAGLAATDPRPNASLAAILEAHPVGGDGWTTTAIMPFSSARKWSGASFPGHGHWVLGAPDVLLPDGDVVRAEAEQTGAKGLRVLLLGSCTESVDAPTAPGTVQPAALVVLEQRIRPEAGGTLRYFAEQDVDVKVISGDNAVSVGAVAASLHLPHADHPVDARELPTDRDQLADRLEAATVFGRVAPAQKRDMVGALQSRGHTVAMTGDGVNDVLALKDADIGVAMGSGSPASRAVAQIVLLDNSFATLPHVVAEGRRVIGNIERVANLFLTKTVYSVLLAALVIVFLQPYPFAPRHLTLIGSLTIGIPAFFLALAPNTERAQTGFVKRVLRLALPSGVIVGLATVVTMLLVNGMAATQPEKQTAAVLTLFISATWVLVVVARPYAWWKIGLIAAMVGLFLGALLIPFWQRFWALTPGDWPTMLVGITVAAVASAMIEFVYWFFHRAPRKASTPSAIAAA
jgi:cation-transporting ATPase E